MHCLFNLCKSGRYIWPFVNKLRFSHKQGTDKCNNFNRVSSQIFFYIFILTAHDAIVNYSLWYSQPQKFKFKQPTRPNILKFKKWSFIAKLDNISGSFSIKFKKKMAETPHCLLHRKTLAFKLLTLLCSVIYSRTRRTTIMWYTKKLNLKVSCFSIILSEKSVVEDSHISIIFD